MEEDRLAGRAGITPNELDSYLDSIIDEVEHGKDKQYKVIVSYRARQMLANHVRFLAQKSPLPPVK